jgi:hypothetical protein
VFQHYVLVLLPVIITLISTASVEAQPEVQPPFPSGSEPVPPVIRPVAPALDFPATGSPQAVVAAPSASFLPPISPKASVSTKPLTAVAVGYDKGLTFRLEDGTFKARIGLRTQFRLESTRPTDAGSEVSNRIFIPRSRLQLDGTIFGESNRYKLDFGLGDRGSFSFLKDLYVEKAIASAWIRVGQWKRPFNRQELVSDFASQFNERANTAEYVGGGRDLGIAFHNDYEQSPQGVEWVVGVFNGFSGGSDRPVLTTKCSDATPPICMTAAPTTFPDDWGPTLVVRAGWNSPGMKGYSEADLEGGPVRYAVSLGYKIDLADFDQGGESSTTENLSHGLQIDGMLKVSGFSLEFGSYMMKLKSADVTFGAMVQAGYMLLPTNAEVAARFAVAPTTGDREQVEIRGAFNWYWEGHRWKWATDVGLLKQSGRDPATTRKDAPDYQLRSMAQLTF